MPPVIKVGDQNVLVETKDFSLAKFSFDKFNPIQSRVLDYYDKNNNIVVSASTSSGKTALSEMVLSYEIRILNGKGIYLVPLKALAQEKYDEWTDKNHHFFDLKVSVCTGDYRMSADRKKELDNADLIIMSYEMFNCRVRNVNSERSEFLLSVGTLVVDECFPAKTRVCIENNIALPIKRIIEDDSIKHVLSYDENSGQIIKKKILRKITKNLSGGLLSIKHQYGSFTCTDNHKIYTYNRGYIEAKDLKPGDKLKWIEISNELTCPLCGEEFKNKQALVPHYLYKHISPGKNAVHVHSKKICPKCGKEIDNYGYASHVKWCGIEKIPEPPKSTICDICGKVFESFSKKVSHEMHHGRSKESYLESAAKAAQTCKTSAKYIAAMKKMGLNRMGKNNPVHTCPGTIEKLKKIGRDRWDSLSEEQKQAQIQRFINAPLKKTSNTSLEKFVEKVSIGLPIRRTSGGNFWLKFKNKKSKNPDFKVNGVKKVIEIGDTEYWHTNEEIAQTVMNYRDIGYQCLYLTNKDVLQGENYVRKIIEVFLANHTSEVLSVKKWGRGGIDKVYNLEVEDTHNYFANGVLVSNCHLVGSPSRGHHLESALMKFTEVNTKCRLVLLSATMPNVDELANWVSFILTNNNTVLIKSNYRPCPLFIHYEKYYDGERNYYDNEKEKVNSALEVVEYYPDDKFLVFVHTKGTGKLMLEALRDAGIKAEFHNGDLEKSQRLKIEKEFKEGKGLRVIVATSTLAAGINCPARRAVIVGVHRGLDEVEVNDILQMCGRSGRPQFDPAGDAYILLPEKMYDLHKARLKTPQLIQSQMLDHVNGHHKALAFHLVSEIHQESIKNKDDVHHWYKRSLASFQANTLDDSVVDHTMDLLKKCGAVWEEDGQYTITSIGKIASLFYFSPFDVSDLKKNFTNLFDNNKQDDDIWLSVALANLDTHKFGIVSRAERDAMNAYANQVHMNFGRGTIWEPVIKIGYIYHQALNALTNPVFVSLTRTLQSDFPRLNQVLQAIDGFTGKWGKQHWFNDLQLRVIYGVKGPMVILCALPGVGKARATKLWNAGIQSYIDVINNPDKVRKLTGLKTDKVDEILLEAKRLL